MPGEKDFSELVKSIPELDTEQAVEDFGGLWSAYEKTVTVFVRLLPQKIGQMDAALRGNDLSAFAIQTHGLRGTLNQIGYKALGTCAEELENAAKAGDEQYCIMHYTAFAERLLLFYDRMKMIVSKDRAAGNIPLSNINDFIGDIEKAWSAIDDYDVLSALEFLSPLENRRFGDRTDRLLSMAVNELEAFNAEKAMEYISELRNECGSERQY